MQGVRHARHGRDALHFRHIDEGEKAPPVEAQERVPGAFDAVHPEKRDEFHSDYIGKELQLRLHVLRGEGEVMDSVGPGHGVSLHAETVNRRTDKSIGNTD